MSDQQSPSPVEQRPPNAVRIRVPERKPLVTWIILALTVLFFLGQYLTEAIYDYDLLFFLGGKINRFILLGQFWRLLTPALLHGSILHLALNMYALYVLGRRMERFYGHWRFLALYWLSAFAGNVLSFVLTPAPSLGASTAIFGLLSAEGIFILQNRKLFGKVRTNQMLGNLAFILLVNLSYGFMPGTNIDNMGHIGGFLGGLFFAWKAGPLLRLSGSSPYFSIVDERRRGEMWLAGLIVFVGFMVMAIIPFISL